MKRVLKFRAWHNLNKVMYDNKSIPVLAKNFENEDSIWEFMQYTGLKDKNGKDIYDGDILAQECRMIDDYMGEESIEIQKLVVKWSDTRPEWTVYCPSAPNRSDWGHVPNTKTYVIGNIYQNTELLT